MELLAGLALALVVLALVLEPLVRGRPWPAQVTGDTAPDELDSLEPEESESAKVQALLALREIEFDKETGKLSDEDYVLLKNRYQQEALRAIAVEDRDAEAEAPEETAGDSKRPAGECAVCPNCGPRPESSARFCSDCGRNLLPGKASSFCSSCGEPMVSGAKYCGECGAKS